MRAHRSLLAPLSARTVFWGILLLGAFVIFFSLIAVQVIHPINRDIVYEGCSRCPHAFGSVWDALCTFVQQVVAGDAWGTISLPVIDAAPWTLGGSPRIPTPPPSARRSTDFSAIRGRHRQMHRTAL